MPYSQLSFKPGVYKDDTPLEAGNYWVDLDKMRFVRGLPETIYGWERASTTALLGYCRGLFTYADNGRNPFAAIGTHLREYAMDLDGNITDITPWTSRGYTSLSFTTVITSSTVTLTWTAHGLIAGQKFQLENSATASVGGVTINGTYVVVSVVDANNITYVAAQVATSNAGPTAVLTMWTQYLSPGAADGIGGLGYGTGGYGSAGYVSPSSGLVYFPRTWSLDAWGENLISNPRGGTVYEWAPNVTATELVINGTFTGGATAFTLGSGWAYGTNSVVATNASSDLSQIVTLPVGAWCRLVTNCTAYTSGTVKASIKNVVVNTLPASTGYSPVSFFSNSGGAVTLAMTGQSANLTLATISVQVEPYGNPITNAPAIISCAFVTAERILVACGVPSDVTGRFDGAFDAMRIAWTDTQNNQTWLPAGTNLAGSYSLSNGSRIVKGLPGNGINFLLTDTAATVMKYTADPTSVYSFTEVGSACGLIGPNALTEVGGIFYWMDPAGGFWSFNGSYPAALQCTLGRDVQDHVAWAQQDKVYAFPVTVAGRQEVWWLYPDSRDGVECSRYVGYCITESNTTETPVWINGVFDRSAWHNAGVFQFPLAVDLTGTIWFQEKGFSADGGQRSAHCTTGYISPAGNGNHSRLLNFQADIANQQGNYSITVNSRIRNSRGFVDRQFGPYNVQTSDAKTAVRANGEEWYYRFDIMGSPMFWRLGAYRHEIMITGRNK